eukprot:TRINITY_DN1147_c4_g1_i1.p1 TRINITY_DN1147_c4_g1~~TRINITY_DN1147_c4_g1_i1.p1  ORF type:complete len:479 (+),score=102.08 TRINITY_DN1147_c4_g1_i1:28-1437(+)
MVFGDFLKDAMSAVSEVVHGNDDSAVTVLTKSIMVARPPGDGALLGRGAAWVASRIKKEGGSECLMIDTCGGYDDLLTIHDGPISSYVGPVSLQLVWTVVRAIDEHIRTHPKRAKVCFLDPSSEHSKTATYIICYTLFTNLFSDVTKAIEYYKSKRRIKNLSFLPSHLRYIEYFNSKMQDKIFTPPVVLPAFVRLITLRNVPVAVAMKRKLSLEIEHVRAVFKDGDPNSSKAKTIATVMYTPGSEGIMPAKDLSGLQRVDIEVLVNTFIEEDFRAVLWCVNEYRRTEILFSVQLHTAYLFGGVENGVVMPLTWQEGDVCREVGKDFSIEIDVVSERRHEPIVEECGSLWIVTKPEGLGDIDQSRLTEPPLSPRFELFAHHESPPSSPFKFPRNPSITTPTSAASAASFPGPNQSPSPPPPQGLSQQQQQQLQAKRTPTPQLMQSTTSTFPRPASVMFQSCISTVSTSKG